MDMDQSFKQPLRPSSRNMKAGTVAASGESTSILTGTAKTISTSSPKLKTYKVLQKNRKEQ